MTPYQFGQFIKHAIDMTSPEYAARMRAYAGQMRSQGVNNIQFSPDAKIITGINTKRPGVTPAPPGGTTAFSPAQPKNPAVQPLPTPVKGPAPAPQPTAPAPNRPVVRRSRSDF